MDLPIIRVQAHQDNYRIYGGRRQVTGIVIHVMDGTLAGTATWFRAGKEGRGSTGMPGTSGVSSAHYGVGCKGEIHQYCDENDVAFHAGRVSPDATWSALAKHSGISPNEWTIGIEHEGRASDEWPDPMYEASARLIADIARRHGFLIDHDHVCGHREIYALKTCPGKCDLDKLIALARAEHEAEVKAKT